MNWQPIETAPKDGTSVLLRFKNPIPREGNGVQRQWAGLQFVGRHPGVAEDGFDIGWSFAAPVGMGGFPDEWLEGWMPLLGSIFVDGKALNSASHPEGPVVPEDAGINPEALETVEIEVQDELVENLRMIAKLKLGDPFPGAWQKHGNWQGWAEELSKVAGQAADRIESLGVEVARLRRDCAEAYQVVGYMETCREDTYTREDTTKALDNLSAAASDKPRPHDDLLPWPKVNKSWPYLS